jgi:hypothetical protein
MDWVMIFRKTIARIKSQSISGVQNVMNFTGIYGQIGQKEIAAQRIMSVREDQE